MIIDVLECEKMVMSFKTLEGLFVIQFFVHIIIVLVLQILYINSENESHRKLTLRSWLLMISPLDPDKKGMTQAYCQTFMGCIWLTAVEYLTISYLEGNRLHILYQLKNPREGKVARDNKIDQYIEYLLGSNQTSILRLTLDCPKDKLTLVRLKQERLFLLQLKSHKDILVPGLSSRYDLRRKFLYLSTIALVYTYTHAMAIIVQAIRVSNVFHELKDPGFVSSFLCIKLFFEGFIGLMIYMNRFTLVLVSYIISMLHYRDMLESLKSLIRQLSIITCENSNDQLHIDFKQCDILEDITRESLNVNSLALIAYIRLRYILDSSTMGLISQTIGFVFITRLPDVLYNIIFNINRSNSLIAITLRGPLSLWDLFQLGCAHQYSQNSWLLRRSLSMILASIFPRKENKSIEMATTSHTRHLWLRIIENETKLGEKFALYLLGSYKLNYDLWLQIQYHTYFITFLCSRNISLFDESK